MIGFFSIYIKETGSKIKYLTIIKKGRLLYLDDPLSNGSKSFMSLSIPKTPEKIYKELESDWEVSFEIPIEFFSNGRSNW